MDDRIKLGIVGTGKDGDRMADAAKNADGIFIAGVYSPDEEKGAGFAARHGLLAHYTDYYAMLRDVDAVYIASSTFAHCEQAVAAMERGRDVLCEKMMAASYGQALRMRAAADKNEVVLLEAMHIDFTPALLAIRRGMEKIGKIRRAHLECCEYSEAYGSFKAGEVLNPFRPEICNSALCDVGVYPLHLAVLLFGKPLNMRASAVLLENGFEGMGNITLEYQDMLCEVSYSKITEGVSPSVIEGESGSLIIDGINHTRRVTVITRDGAREEIPFVYRRDDTCYELRAFIDMLFARRSNTEYLAVTLETVRLVSEAYRQTGALKYMNIELMK